MEFSEKRAIEIKSEFNIPDATIKTWRHRGNIPDKYFKEGFNNASLGIADKQLEKDMMKALACGKINIVILSELSGVNRDKIADFQRSKGKLSKEELSFLRKSINKIKIETKQMISILEKPGNMEHSGLKKLDAYLKSKIIYPFKIIGQDRLIWAKLEGWLSNKSSFPYAVRKNLLHGFLVFSVEISL